MLTPYNDGTGRLRGRVSDLAVGDTLCGSGMTVLHIGRVTTGGYRHLTVRYRNGKTAQRVWRSSTTIAVKARA